MMENIQERERVNINLYTIFNLTKQNNEFTLINNHDTISLFKINETHLFLSFIHK